MESPRNSWLARMAVTLLMAVLGVGLWQAYGSWLTKAVRAHVA